MWRSLTRVVNATGAISLQSNVYRIPQCVAVCSSSIACTRSLLSTSTRTNSSDTDRPRLIDERVNSLLAQQPSRLPSFIQRLIATVKHRLGKDVDSQLDPDVVVLMERASAQLYYDCANNYPYLKLCEAFGLNDYVSTWFKLTLMHIWMVLLRLHVSLDAEAYMRLQRGLLSTMWMDVDQRLEVIGGEIKQSLTTYGDMKHMHGLHIQTLLEYDEGFLSDDTALAAAVWRCLYLQRSCDPIQLNMVVNYMRSTVAYLDTLDLNDILVDGIKEWKTLKPTGSEMRSGQQPEKTNTPTS